MERDVLPIDISRAKKYFEERSKKRDGEEGPADHNRGAEAPFPARRTPTRLPVIAPAASDGVDEGAADRMLFERAGWYQGALRAPSAATPATAAVGHIEVSKRTAALRSPQHATGSAPRPRARTSIGRASTRAAPPPGRAAATRDIDAFEVMLGEVASLQASRRRVRRQESSLSVLGDRGDAGGGELGLSSPHGADSREGPLAQELAGSPESLEAFIAKRLLASGRPFAGAGAVLTPRSAAIASAEPPLLALSLDHAGEGDGEGAGADGGRAPPLHAAPLRALVTPRSVPARVGRAPGQAVSTGAAGVPPNGSPPNGGAARRGSFFGAGEAGDRRASSPGRGPDDSAPALQRAGRSIAERVSRVTLDVRELCIAIDNCADDLPSKSAPTARVLRRATRTLASLFGEMMQCFAGIDAFRREWCSAAREWYALEEGRFAREIEKATRRADGAETAVEALRGAVRAEESRAERLQRDLDTTIRIAEELRRGVAASGAASVTVRAVPRVRTNAVDSEGRAAFDATKDLIRRNLELERYVDAGRGRLERSLGLQELRDRARRTAWRLRHDASVQTSVDDDADWDVDGGISLLAERMEAQWMLAARAPFNPRRFVPVGEKYPREPNRHLAAPPPRVWVSELLSGRSAVEEHGEGLQLVTLAAAASRHVRGVAAREVILVRGPWAARAAPAEGDADPRAAADPAAAEGAVMAFDVTALASLPPVVLVQALQRNAGVRAIAGMRDLAHRMRLLAKGSQRVPAPSEQSRARGADGTLQGESFADFVRRTQMGAAALGAGLRRRRRFLYSEFFLEFLANAPATAAAARVEPLAWVRNAVWECYDEKSIADEADLADGAKLQALEVFVVERALARGDRPEAELALVRLLRALERHARDPRVALFARFLGTHPKPLDTIVATAFLASRRRLLRLATLHRLVERRRRASDEADDKGELDAEFRDNVYLLLGDKAGESKRRRRGARNREAETDWVLVEHGAAVLFETLSFLPRSRKEDLARFLATNSAMRNRRTGALMATDNSAPVRTAARAQIRRDIFDTRVDTLLQGYSTQLDDPEPPPPLAQTHDETFEVVARVDTVMDVLAKELEKRQGVLFMELMRLFRDGDTNGDGVLDFPEFLAIVRSTSTKVSDRQALRMFREALTKGANSATISQTAFVEVCVDHGIVTLLEAGDDGASQGGRSAITEESEGEEGEGGAGGGDAQAALKYVESLAEMRRAEESATESLGTSHQDGAGPPPQARS